MPELTRTEKFFVNRRGVRSLSRLLDRLDRSGQFSPGVSSDVLELGGGNGRLSMLVNERYHPAQIKVTDFDTEQLAVARRVWEERYGSIPPNISLERVDATRMPYSDGSFDLVMAHYVLHHLGTVPDILHGLEEVHRVLRPNGRFFYVEMFHKQEIREFLRKLGFSEALRSRAWRFFDIADVSIAAKP
jgi:ubiquinone/menaquinone biosynthesis C-methylase UbiE